ncbi:MAG: MarR family transcriptional regulator [Bacillota bacterium]|nr:MarR family transcriptional regulator [Bacillota bacterium]
MEKKQYEKYDALKLGVQLCFPLYACSKEMVRLYKPYLDELGLTYTQYITMLVLWEKEKLTVKELGKRLYLDSGTLTPLLKKLEQKGLIFRERSKEDERNLFITLTEAGVAMKDQALHIPYEMVKCVELDTEEKRTLYQLLYKLLSYVDKEEKE